MSYKTEKLKELAIFVINSSVPDDVSNCLFSNKALLRITNPEELLLSYYKAKTRWSTKASNLSRLWEGEFIALTNYYTSLKEGGVNLKVLSKWQEGAYLKSRYKKVDRAEHRAFLKTLEIRVKISLN